MFVCLALFLRLFWNYSEICFNLFLCAPIPYLLNTFLLKIKAKDSSSYFECFLTTPACTGGNWPFHIFLNFILVCWNWQHCCDVNKDCIYILHLVNLLPLLWNAKSVHWCVWQIRRFIKPPTNYEEQVYHCCNDWMESQQGRLTQKCPSL